MDDNTGGRTGQISRTTLLVAIIIAIMRRRSTRRVTGKGSRRARRGAVGAGPCRARSASALFFGSSTFQVDSKSSPRGAMRHVMLANAVIPSPSARTSLASISPPASLSAHCHRARAGQGRCAPPPRWPSQSNKGMAVAIGSNPQLRGMRSSRPRGPANSTSNVEEAIFCASYWLISKACADGSRSPTLLSGRGCRARRRIIRAAEIDRLQFP